MKALITALTFCLTATSTVHAEEAPKHFQMGISSFATTVSFENSGIEDDEFTGFSLYGKGAPTDNFAMRGLYAQQEHDDFQGLDLNALEISALAGTGLATEGFKAYGSFGFFDEELEANNSSIDFNGAMIGAGIGYNWAPVGIDFWFNLRDSSDYEDLFPGADVVAASDGLGIAARF